MDAISFVLGVKTQQLRSSQLRDLINRPEGAPEPEESASVALVFEPAEGESIRFERVISPRGSATYKMNGKTVSWAKYNETLEGMGILVQARNFLVFQGDVESIASKTPADLSLLLEHVSGSIEFKDEYETLKRAKEKAEENTIYNFNKKKTLKAEKKQYKQQKEEAEAWQELSRERDEIQQEQALFQLYHLGNELDLLSVRLTAQLDEEEAIASRKAHISTTVKKRKKEQAKAHSAVLRLQKKLLAIQSKKTKAKPDHIRTKTQIEHVTAKLAEKRAALERKEGEAAKQNEELAKLNGMLADLERLAAEFEETLPESLRLSEGEGGEGGENGAGGNLSMSSLNVSSRLDEVLNADQLNQYHELKAAATAETATLSGQLAGLERMLTDERSRLQVAQNKADEVSSKVVLLREAAAGLVERQANGEAYVAKHEAELEQCRSTHASVAAQASNVAARTEELTALLTETDAKLREASAHSRQSKHDAKMAESLEAMKRLFPGVHGKVVHLCATQAKYQLALTVAMGRYVDAIVVDTQATAIECIEYMRENRVGTATFLPLNSLKVKAIDERFRSLGGTATLAVDVVEYEEIYAPAFEFILGSTVLAQGLTEARALAFGDSSAGVSGVRKKVVTWDGTKITKSGLITGGSSGDDSSAALWSEKNVSKYRAARTEYEAELASLVQSRRLKTQAEGLATRIEALESRVSRARADLAATRDKLHDNELEVTSLQGTLASLEPTIAALQSSIAEHEAEVGGLETQISSVEDRVFGELSAEVGVGSIRELEASALAEAQRAAKKRLAFSKQRAQLRNQITYQSSHDYEPELEELRESIVGEEAKLAKLEGKAIKAGEALLALDESKAELEVELANAKSAEDEVAAQVKALKADDTRLGKEHSVLLTEITATEGALESLAAKRSAIFQRCLVSEIPIPVGDERVLSAKDVEGGEGPGELAEGVEIDFSGLARTLKAVDSGTERMPPGKYAEYDAAFEERLRLISKDIETMAPNMKAIERLDDLAAKFKATSAEFDDARNASKVANDAFMKVQRLRTARYMEAFNHISRVIDEIYKELTRSELNYGGGTAFLSLEAPDEPYLSGVKFNAMPPNKRFRNMEFLSGGEKTVAALALLFAIHSYRPSPFFVMDEVDAALDSKNVKRVAEYIRARSAEFQCIVISLKDTFFDKADALVGIYRDRDDEDGGATHSKTLTLDLRSYE